MKRGQLRSIREISARSAIVFVLILTANNGCKSPTIIDFAGGMSKNSGHLKTHGRMSRQMVTSNERMKRKSKDRKRKKEEQDD